MAFSDFLQTIGTMLFGAHSRPRDIRTPQMQQMDVNRLAMTQDAQARYAAAQANPNAGMPDLPTQHAMVQALRNQTYNEASARGGGFSPMNDVNVMGKIADFNRQMFTQRLGYLSKLGEQASGLSGQSGAFPMGVIGAQPGVIPTAAGLGLGKAFGDWLGGEKKKTPPQIPASNTGGWGVEGDNTPAGLYGPMMNKQSEIL